MKASDSRVSAANCYEAPGSDQEIYSEHQTTKRPDKRKTRLTDADDE